MGGKLHWHNYVAGDHKHIFTPPAGPLQCFMLTSTFGATTAFLEQLHLRMVREQVTFVGESDVAVAYAKRRGLAGLLPTRLRLHLSKLWYVWRLCIRSEVIRKCGHSMQEVNISGGVEELVAERWQSFVEEFEASTAARVRAAGMRTDVHVVDGNAKNRRLVCAAELRHTIRSVPLQRCIRTCCPRTPLLGAQFCAGHAAGSGELGTAVDYEIIGHAVPGAATGADGDDLRLEVRRQGGDDAIWVSEAVLPPPLVTEYFRNQGAARLAARGARKKQRLQARQGWRQVVGAALHAVADDWNAMTDAEKAAALPERSSPADLTAVACRTHKESESASAELSKTAGILCSCISSGIIVVFREMYGCESLSQRYVMLSDLLERYPECTMVVHDDACHLHKFAAARASWSPQSTRLAPPQVRYVCDPFHMAGHVDPWCLTHCNPACPDVAPALQNIRTSVCEFTFTWLSAYKHQTKHMSEWGFKLFLLEMVAAHNEAIFSGTWRPGE